MSVQKVGKVDISPVHGNGNLIGIFGKQETTVGDGSGGTVSFNMKLGETGVENVYFVLKQFSAYRDDTGVATKIATYTGYLNPAPVELTATGLWLFGGTMNDSGINTWYSDNETRLLGRRNNATNEPLINTTFSVNTNAINYYVFVRGYVFKGFPNWRSSEVML